MGAGIAHLTADGTSPGGERVAIHQKELFSLPRQLVAQALPKHPEPGVQRVPRQRLLFGHVPDGIAPSCTRHPSLGYPPGFLVDEVAPLVGNVLMDFTVLLHRFLIIFGTGPHPAELPLNFSQFFLRPFQPMRGICDSAIVRRVEVGHGVFQPNRCFHRWYNRLWLPHGVLVENVGVKFSRLCFSTVTRLSFHPFRRRRGNTALTIPVLVMRMPFFVM